MLTIRHSPKSEMMCDINCTETESYISPSMKLSVRLHIYKPCQIQKLSYVYRMVKINAQLGKGAYIKYVCMGGGGGHGHTGCIMNCVTLDTPLFLDIC